jgi:hypothetical protein
VSPYLAEHPEPATRLWQAVRTAVDLGEAQPGDIDQPVRRPDTFLQPIDHLGPTAINSVSGSAVAANASATELARS